MPALRQHWPQRRRGADIALANKECLVSAGPLFIEAVRRGGGRLLPVDSEHNAIFQVLEEHQRHAVERIILTASGGPFRQSTLTEMEKVTVDTARAHPNWSMGLKISIDSASMFNKALEMIEAKHLFNLDPQQIEVIVHPQSVIHSMVAYSDGSVLAQLGCPDMRTAIGYALSHPRRCNLPVERLDFAKLSRLDFEAPDEVRFPALRLARLAMQRGGAQGRGSERRQGSGAGRLHRRPHGLPEDGRNRRDGDGCAVRPAGSRLDGRRVLRRRKSPAVGCRADLKSIGRAGRFLGHGPCERATRPELVQRSDEMVDVLVGMQRRRCDAQALGLLRHRRIVDRLDIDAAIVEQQVGDPLALRAASPTSTGTMWLGLGMCGMPFLSSRLRRRRTRS